ncbi:ROK family transcriptional regulator [Saccharospirillum salsuginis]|uniref:Sugar kinase of the NBD/HSP70 family, may contain an N-terminal HTH domain n=1 Tax=Saccharospirillum salsuginis TaxID=418750 RepID=A0A918N933_9GAMM|nr:ROK family transcriptional regulator [Saccharospirillum salsuginis]GGX52601.1 hypothetical protein GCM10007392_19970 [Saccharospirillum salsuginis]
MARPDTRRRLPRPSELATMTDRRFFRCLLEQGPMSRAAIAQATGISKPTISESAQRLLAQSLIVETSRRTQGHQGRSGVLYDINAERGHSLGIALESGRLQARALDLKAGEVWRHEVPLATAGSPDDLVALVHKMIALGREQTGTELLSLGFSVADPVDPKTGEVVPLPDSPFPVGHDLNLLKDFDTAGYPVTLDNDVNWATLAEKALGCARDADDFLYVYLGQGIGAGLYQSGRLQRGNEGLAGEIGYVQTPDGETLLSLTNRQAGQPWDDLTLTSVGHAIAMATVLLNPALVVLGGPRVDASDAFNRLKAVIEARTPRPVSIEPSGMRSDGPLVGVSIGAHQAALRHLGMTEPA